MLTKDDKNWIEETIEDKIEEKLVSIEESNIRTEEKLDKVLNILDGFSGKVADLEQENKFGAVILNRHDIQIHELATATSTTISE